MVATAVLIKRDINKLFEDETVRKCECGPIRYWCNTHQRDYEICNSGADGITMVCGVIDCEKEGIEIIDT